MNKKTLLWTISLIILAVLTSYGTIYYLKWQDKKEFERMKKEKQSQEKELTEEEQIFKEKLEESDRQRELLLQETAENQKSETQSQIKQVASPDLPELYFGIFGFVQPHIVNPDGLGSGVNNCATGEFEQNIPGSDVVLNSENGSIKINNPTSGTYQVCLKTIIDDNFSVEISYGDSAGYSEYKAEGIYHKGTKYNFSFKLNTAAQNKISIIEPVIHPTAVDASNHNGLTRISWIASTDASVTGYNIYSKSDREPLYTLLASVDAQTNLFDTKHLWNDSTKHEWGDGTNMLYVVLSKNVAGLESLYSDVAVNSVSAKADFDVDKPIGTAPLTVKFTDTSLGAPTSWKWDFDGDGVIDSTEQNPTFTYTKSRNYGVRLEVFGPNGYDYETGDIRVSTLANFDVDKSAGVAPLVVKFTDTSLGAPTSWKWDFDGDGVVDSTVQNPTFTFTQNRKYRVKLEISGPSGKDSIKREFRFSAENSTIPFLYR